MFIHNITTTVCSAECGLRPVSDMLSLFGVVVLIKLHPVVVCETQEQRSPSPLFVPHGDSSALNNEELLFSLFQMKVCSDLMSYPIKTTRCRFWFVSNK